MSCTITCACGRETIATGNIKASCKCGRYAFVVRDHAVELTHRPAALSPSCPSCREQALSALGSNIVCGNCGDTFVPAPRLPGHDKSWAIARQDAVDKLSERLDVAEKELFPDFEHSLGRKLRTLQDRIATAESVLDRISKAAQR